MKLQRLIPSMALVVAQLACTPIAPSIHKSVLRSGDSQRVLPNPSPSAQTPQLSQRLSSEHKDSQLEIRWVRDDEQLSEELDSDKVTELKKLSLEELGRLRREALIRITALDESSDESIGPQVLPLRVILRVQMSEERLQEKVAAESWKFWWEDDSKKTLGISYTELKTEARGQIAEALVSVHIVTDKKTK